MTGAVDYCLPIPWALIASSNDTNLRNFFGAFVSVTYFGVLVFNIILEWG